MIHHCEQDAYNIGYQRGCADEAKARDVTNTLALCRGELAALRAELAECKAKLAAAEKAKEKT